MTGAITHVAGLELTWDDRFLRQRCAWCGATLLDYDLANIGVPVGQDPKPSNWPVGAFVRVDGHMSNIVKTECEHRAPEDACLRLDVSVTK